MSRGTRFLTLAIPLTFLYLLLLLNILPIPFISQETTNQILPVLPFWLLVTFGSWSLTSLGLGLLRFRDCPEAYSDLLVEVNQAKNELRDQGVNVD